jgi:heme exporter protein D
MMTGLTARSLYLSPMLEAYYARERAWRAGDATTLHLLELAVSAAVQRRRIARVARRRLARQRMT